MESLALKRLASSLWYICEQIVIYSNIIILQTVFGK